MAQLELRGIDKVFGQAQALSGIYLSVTDGEFVSLVGPSGCGKTTLLRIIAGLESPSQGEITIGEQVVNELDPAQRNIAMVFQSYALYPHKTVFENIAFPLRMQAPWLTRVPLLSQVLPARKSLDGHLHKRVSATAALMDLEPLLNRKPGQLSGGQRQRVALARAMVRDPKLFLMDEPLSNLDAKLRSAMRAEIIELQRRLKATFIYVTHDQSEAMTMSDRVVLLNQGCIQQIGAPNELYDNPANRFVAEFIGSPKINMLAVKSLRRRELEVFGITLKGLPERLDNAPLPLNQNYYLALRPEALTIKEDQVTSNTIPGTVHILENLGNEFLVSIRPPQYDEPFDRGDRHLVVRVPADRGRCLKPGDRVYVQPLWHKALLFSATGFRLTQQTVAEEVRV